MVGTRVLYFSLVLLALAIGAVLLFAERRAPSAADLSGGTGSQNSRQSTPPVPVPSAPQTDRSAASDFTTAPVPRPAAVLAIAEVAAAEAPLLGLASGQDMMPAQPEASATPTLEAGLEQLILAALATEARTAQIASLGERLSLNPEGSPILAKAPLPATRSARQADGDSQENSHSQAERTAPEGAAGLTPLPQSRTASRAQQAAQASSRGQALVSEDLGGVPLARPSRNLSGNASTPSPIPDNSFGDSGTSAGNSTGTARASQTASAAASETARSGDTRSYRPQFENSSSDSSAAACFARLQAAGVRFRTLPPMRDGAGCSLTNAVEVSAFGNISVRPSAKLTCTMAERSHAWLQQKAKPAAQRLLGSTLVGIENVSSYACRRIDNKNRWSEHASGNALDIAGFYLSSGQHVKVLDDWGDGSAAARFLDRISRDSCAYFQVVLNPLSDAAHRDHFHLDAGRWRSCPY